MKRLLALLGLTSLVVLTACFYLGETFAVILGVSAGLLFFLTMFIPFARKEGTYPVAFITAVIAVCMFLGYTNFYVNPIKAYAKTTAEITAVQQDYVYHNNGYYNYILKVKSIAGKKVDTKMRLCSKQALFTEPYDELKFTADLSFTDNKSYYAQKIFLQAYFYSEEDVEVTKPDSKPLMYYIKSLRKDLSTALYLEMDYDTAAFSSAILLGDKNALEPDAKELLRSAGLSHIAVVSGLHLSIVGAIFAKIFD